MIFFDPTLALDGVRQNLALLDRLSRSHYLSYSDAFPFNELRVFGWPPVAERLRAERLLNCQLSCRYRDPRVAELVVNIASMMAFKKARI